MDNEALMLRFHPLQQKQIKYVCLYLGIKYLSEIRTIDGQSLFKGINNGNEEHIQFKNLLACPVQLKPNLRSWVL